MPARRRWSRAQGCPDLLDTFLMSFRGVGDPTSKCMGDIEAGCIVQHGGPAIREMLGQLAYELPAHQSRHLMASLRLFDQRAEDLHSGDVVLAQFFGQRYQRGGGARLGESGERIVPALADPLIEAGLPVALPGAVPAHLPPQGVKFIGILYSFIYPATTFRISLRVNIRPASSSASPSAFMIIRFHSLGHVRPRRQLPPP